MGNLMVNLVGNLLSADSAADIPPWVQAGPNEEDDGKNQKDAGDGVVWKDDNYDATHHEEPARQ